MKNYELSVLIHPDLEMNPDPAIDKLRKIIESAGGKIIKEDNEGKKRLAYQISGQSFAIYYYMDVVLPSDAPGKVSSTLNITDEVLRYLLVRTDERRAKLEAKRNAEEQSSEGDSSKSKDSVSTIKEDE